MPKIPPIRLPGSALAIHHVVIVDDVDAPKTGNLAMITEMEDGFLVARYLAQPDYPMAVAIGFNSTPLAEFGYRCLTDGQTFWVDMTRAKSRATYRDGAPRPWQGQINPQIPLSRHGKKALEAYMSLREKLKRTQVKKVSPGGNDLTGYRPPEGC